jgi:putative copper resistance protein D
MGDWLLALLRALHYVLLLGLFGVATYRLIGLRGLSCERFDARARIGLLAAAVIALITSIMLMLAMIAGMMGQTIGELEREGLLAMVVGTSIGWAFVLRIGCLTGAAVALVVGGRSAFWVCATLVAVALCTLPWSGHAAAGEGGIGLLHRANDAVHLLSAGLWLGAIGWFLHLTALARRPEHRDLRLPLLAAMHCFAPVGAMLVLIVCLSGFVNAQMIFGIKATPDVLDTTYGWLLALKLLLVGVMIAFGGRNAIVVRRGTARASTTDAMLTSLRTSLRLEIGTAAVVVGTVAILGLMSPMLE